MTKGTSKNDLLINDQEFIFSEKVLLAYIDTLCEVTANYCKTLSKISDGTFTDVLITNRISDLVDHMNQINTTLIDISEALQGKTKQFIDDVDEKDDFIY